MTIRDAKRPLAGEVGWHDPEILRGRYTTSEYDRVIYTGRGLDRVDIGDQPVVSVNLNGGRSGTRTFTDPGKLRALADELHEAAQWLARQQVEDAEKRLLTEKAES